MESGTNRCPWVSCSRRWRQLHAIDASGFATVSFTQDLPHPHRKLSKKWADRAFAYHAWSMHQGNPEQRINRVKELGYLFVEERPPASCDRLPH